MISEYYNYFTEVEEHFQRACGVTRLLSPKEWALIERWKNNGVPLQAVLRGIDTVFANLRQRRIRPQTVNSLAYCARAIEEEAQRLASVVRAATSFSLSSHEVQAFVGTNSDALRKHGFGDLADSLDAIDITDSMRDLEQLERELTAIEEQLVDRLYASTNDPELTEVRKRLESELKPYRMKMSADQIAALEKQYMTRRLLEASGLPRLSLFYLENVPIRK